MADIQLQHSPAATHSPSRVRKNITLAVLGNVFEFYDFTVYGFVAAYIGAALFAADDPYVALLAGFAVFAVGFIARPLGALILGLLVDRRGRKSVMLFSMLLMAVGTLLIACAPNYGTAGSLGATMAVVGRLAQGFSAGGEHGSSSTFVVEWSYQGRRGLFASFHQVANYVGLLVGVFISAVLTSILGAEAMAAWGWRVPFIIGTFIAVVVFILRRRIEETPVFTRLQTEQPPTAGDSGNGSTRLPALAGVVVAVGIAALGSVCAMITLTYMPAYASTILAIDSQSALWATVIGAVVTILLIPPAGAISDRLGRRPLLVTASVGYAIVSLPLFLLMQESPEFWAIVVTQLVLAPFTACISGVIIATVGELFNAKNRGALVSISFGIGVPLFGGFGTYVCTWLIGAIGNPVAPAFYMIGAAVVTLIATVFVPRDLSAGVLHD